MAKMRAVDAAVLVLEKEGIDCAFGVPGAAINPFYSALKARGSVRHVLARHVEGASHMAEGYTRARAGNIGLCIGTSGPAGTEPERVAPCSAGASGGGAGTAAAAHTAGPEHKPTVTTGTTDAAD